LAGCSEATCGIAAAAFRAKLILRVRTRRINEYGFNEYGFGSDSIRTDH
jgi:hypothetical protein